MSDLARFLTLPVFIASLLGSLSGAAQTDCYHTHMRAGYNAFEKRQYEEAIREYQTAKNCPEARENRYRQQKIDGYIANATQQLGKKTTDLVGAQGSSSAQTAKNPETSLGALPKYADFKSKGDRALSDTYDGHWQKAIDAYEAALKCEDAPGGDPDDLRGKIDKAKDNQIRELKAANRKTQSALQQVKEESRKTEEERKKTEKTARTALANGYAYRSGELLRDGDRMGALRLSEFAHRIVDSTDNPEVLQALINAWYLSQNPRDLPSPLANELFIGEKPKRLKFSPDGILLAVMPESGEPVQFWDMEKFDRPLFVPAKNASNLFFSSNSRWVALTSESAVYVHDLWQVKEPKEIKISQPEFLTLSNSGDALWVSVKDSAKIWQYVWGKETSALRRSAGNTDGNLNDSLTFNSAVTGLYFSPNGEYIQAGTTEGLVYFLEKPRSLNRYSEKGALRLADCSANTRIFLSGANNAVVLKPDSTATYFEFNEEAARLINSPTEAGNGRRTPVEIQAAEHLLPGSFVLSPDNSLLFYRDEETNSWIVEQLGGTKLFKSPGQVFAGGLETVGFSPANQWLALPSPHAGFIQLLELDNGMEEDFSPMASGEISPFRVSSDGARVVANNNWNIYIYNLPDTTKTSMVVPFPNNTYENCVGAAGKKDFILYKKGDSFLTVWDMDTGKSRQLRLDLEGFQYGHMVISPDDQLLALIPEAYDSVYVYDLKSLRRQFVLDAGKHTIQQVAFSANHDQLALVFNTQGEPITLWNIRNGKISHDSLLIVGPKSQVNQIKYAPTGNLLVTSDNERTVRIWSTVNGEEQTTLMGHLADISALEFSNDGKRLASGDDQGNVFVWNTEKMEKMFSLKAAPGKKIEQLEFTPDGRLVTRYKGMIRIWECSVEGILSKLHRRLNLPIAIPADQILAVGLERAIQDEAAFNRLNRLGRNQIMSFLQYFTNTQISTNPEKAAKSYQRAETLHQSLPVADRSQFNSLMANMFGSLAEKHRLYGQYHEAEENARKALGYDGRNNNARLELAHAHHLLGKKELAAAAYLRLQLEESWFNLDADFLLDELKQLQRIDPKAQTVYSEMLLPFGTAHLDDPAFQSAVDINSLGNESEKLYQLLEISKKNRTDYSALLRYRRLSQALQICHELLRGKNSEAKKEYEGYAQQLYLKLAEQCDSLALFEEPNGLAALRFKQAAVDSLHKVTDETLKSQKFERLSRGYEGLSGYYFLNKGDTEQSENCIRNGIIYADSLARVLGDTLKYEFLQLKGNLYWRKGYFSLCQGPKYVTAARAAFDIADKYFDNRINPRVMAFCSLLSGDLETGEEQVFSRVALDNATLGEFLAELEDIGQRGRYPAEQIDKIRKRLLEKAKKAIDGFDGNLTDFSREFALSNYANGKGQNDKALQHALRAQIALNAAKDHGSDEWKNNELNVYFNLSYYYLFAGNETPGNFKKAAEQASLANELATNLGDETSANSVLTNRAHGLLWSGDAKSARDIYDDLKSKRLNNNFMGWEVLLKDFRDLKAAGITHPEVASIVKAITPFTLTEEELNAYR